MCRNVGKEVSAQDRKAIAAGAHEHEVYLASSLVSGKRCFVQLACAGWPKYSCLMVSIIEVGF